MRKVISILLSALFILSNLHLLMGVHYCGGRPVETSILFGKVTLGCGMEDEVDEVCERKKPFSEPGIRQQECCRDLISALQIDDSFKKGMQQSLIPDSFREVFNQPIELFIPFEIVRKSIRIPDRSPPGTVKSVLTFLQVFLI